MTTSGRVNIIDSTLRDGEQAPGVIFCRQDKLRLAKMLAEAGVDELEAGTSAMGVQEQRVIKDILTLVLPCRISVWCRARREDIDAALGLGVPCVHVGFPVSDIVLGTMSKDRLWVLEQLEDLIPYALRSCDFVSVGAMDAFRADSVFLKTFARRAACVGAFRLRLADTVGNAAPPAVMRMIAGLADVVGDMALEFHGHNDLGMATANAVCAAIAGARSLSLTVGGLGERAGNAALEEVVMALPLSAGRTCAVDPRRLPDICRFVASISKRAIPVDKPVSGELIFTHESGIHARALLKDELAYQPYAPSAIGRGQSAIVLGKHSGSAVIAQVLARMGYRVDRRTARLLLERVRDRAATNRGCVSIQELLALYEG